jgi:D-aspartate ligase
MTQFQAVILGGDIGSYALARELNDEYGITPILLTSFTPSVIKDSRIVVRHYFAQTHEEEPLIDELVRLGAELSDHMPSRKLVLLANTDWRIEVLAAHRAQLEKYYIVPIPSAQTIATVADKQTFERIAIEKGMKVPYSFYADFSDTAAMPPDDFVFPAVAKPAISAEYENLDFPGRKKVYFVNNREELADLWQTLEKAGFKGTFIAQQLVHGDDSQMFSVTAYVDSEGKVSLLCSARVLLEEHHPVTLGNPCAMITTAYDGLFEQVTRFFAGLDYHGFANFDVKQDAQTGEFFFLEVNPRIGRNNYYVNAAGANPMKYLIADVVDHAPLPATVASEPMLYTIIPKRLLLRYVTDPALHEQVKELYNAKKVVNPTLNPHDNGFKRKIYQCLAMLNQCKKFHDYYPQATETGF